MVRGDFLIFSSNKSFLFKNNIIEVSVNHLLLQILSNNFNDSCIRFWLLEVDVDVMDEKSEKRKFISPECAVYSSKIILQNLP